jgi:hypothetical protein
MMNPSMLLHCNGCGGAMTLTQDYLARFGGQTTACPTCQHPLVIPTAIPSGGLPTAAPAGQPPTVLAYATAHPSHAHAHAQNPIGYDGVGLVMARNLIGPDRCVKCNAPAEGYQLLRRLSWHHPALYVLILFPGLVIYALVALCVRKTAQVKVGLCPDHRAARRRNVAIAWSLCLLGLAMLIGIPMALSGQRGPDVGTYKAAGAIAGIVTLLVGLVYAAVAVPVVSPRRIDDHYVYLNKAGRPFLESLPRI